MTDEQKPVTDLTDAEIVAELAQPQRKRRLLELSFEQEHRQNVAASEPS